MTLYYSFVYPHLTYCIEVWGKAAEIYLSKLFQLQNRVIRKIKSVPFKAEIGPFFKELRLLNLYQIYRYKTNMLMFQFVKGMLPNVFDSMFTKRNRSVTRITRQLHQLKIPLCRTSAYQNTVYYQGPHEWNVISEKVDHFCSVHAFKRRLKRYLLSI